MNVGFLVFRVELVPGCGTARASACRTCELTCKIWIVDKFVRDLVINLFARVYGSLSRIGGDIAKIGREVNSEVKQSEAVTKNGRL